MEEVVVVQAEATSVCANTVGIVEIRLLEVKKRTVLSDRTCSSLSINDGSLEQYCSIVGWKEKGKLGKQNVLRA